MKKTLEALTAGFIASAALMTSMPVQAQGMGAWNGVAQEQRQQTEPRREQQRRDNRSGYSWRRNQDDSPNSLSNAVRRGAEQGYNPRAENSYPDNGQNYDANAVNLPSVNWTPSSDPTYDQGGSPYHAANQGLCQIGANTQLDGGGPIVSSWYDPSTCRPVAICTPNMIRVFDNAYDGYGRGRTIDIYTSGFTVNSVLINGHAYSAAGYGEQILSRPTTLARGVLSNGNGEVQHNTTIGKLCAPF